MTRHANLVISDSLGIESISKKPLPLVQGDLYALWDGLVSDQPDQSGWQGQKAIRSESAEHRKNYYLILGRFVPRKIIMRRPFVNSWHSSQTGFGHHLTMKTIPILKKLRARTGQKFVEQSIVKTS